MPDQTITLDDAVQPFQIDNLGVRGRMVRLGPMLGDILDPHDYPPAVRGLLAQTVALAATLSSILKYDGIFTLQAQGDGPVGLLVADVTTAGGVRGYARYDADRLAEAGAEVVSVPGLLGAGHLAFTVDQGPDTDRYQGITELTGATLADCAHAYFRQSEQLATAISLMSDDAAGRAGAVMLQRLPARGESDDEVEENWRRAVILLSSLGADELLDPALPAEQLLFRLYHEDDVRVFPKRPVRQTCRCSRRKVETTLRSFPREEIEDLAEDGVVRVTCEFCRTDYVFGPADLDDLYDG